MNPAQIFGDQLRGILPRKARRVIYSLWTLLGVLIGAWQALGWGELGSISVTQALEAYAYASPFVVALAAVNAPKPNDDEVVDWVDDDADLSSFDSVVPDDSVYA